MGWLSLFSPLKDLWLCKTYRKNKGVYILYDDVKSCEYDDVQVLWSLLVESHPPPPCHHLIKVFHSCKNGGRRKQKPLPNGSC